MTTTKTAVAAAAAVAAVLALGACSTGTEKAASSSTAASTSASASAQAHNHADVMFARHMIPHHQQAVEMATMAQERASSADVKQLAERIEAAQGPEIDTMAGWLENWGQQVSPDSEGGMEHSGGDMSGMISDADMESLGTATGAEFDQMFLEMMIEHHTGAIEMAKA